MDARTMRPTESRLHFIDYLRASLVILVVIHHVAMVYGAAAPFYYVEPPPPTQFRSFQALLVFALVNQSYFMGALFLLSGYFTPGSYDRKGAGAFVRDKIARLGIPLVIFVLVLNPLAALTTYLMPSSITGITRGPIWADYPSLVGLGPVWFLALLLIFDGGYAALRAITSRREADARGQDNRGDEDGRKRAFPRVGWIALVAVALAATSYLMRMLVPLGRTVAGFPTLAYLPQYLGFFVLGIAAYRNDWLRRLPVRVGIAGGIAAIVAAVLLLPLAFSGRLFSLSLKPDLVLAFGNGHWRSVVYAAWDSVFSIGIVLALLVLYRAAFNGVGRPGRFLGTNSYAVYLIHTPIVVWIAYVMRDIALAPIPKFVLATIIVTPVCFLAAWAIRKLPGVKRVI